MKTCPECGSPFYDLGCTWCDEEAYIDQQEGFDAEHAKERRLDQLKEKSIATLDNGREWREHYGDIDEQKADTASYTAVGHAAEIER